MKIETRHETAFWLVVSVALLSSLIPGGPVENRDFSHIHPGVLGAFNVFLTTLDMGSVVLAYFAVRRRRWAFNGAFYAALAGGESVPDALRSARFRLQRSLDERGFARAHPWFWAGWATYR